MSISLFAHYLAFCFNPELLKSEVGEVKGVYDTLSFIVTAKELEVSLVYDLTYV